MTALIHMTYEDVHRELPYMMICEAVEGCRWETGKRKRMMKEWFTDAERRKLTEIKKLAHRWALTKGVPDKGVTMAVSTYKLWKKFGDFCASI